MARTIAEIKKAMTDTFIDESVVRERYGLSPTDTFDGSFSKVSIEGLLFYTVAFGIWVMEKLFDSHRAEVDTMLADRNPHTTRWYRNLLLTFVPSWAAEAPVKYCSVDDRGCRLKVKVAGGVAGAREPVSAEAYNAVVAYLADHKDAGIKIEVVNDNSNQMSAALRVWYNPMALVPGSKPVEAALRAHVSNLDFDGLLTRNGIIDTLREVDGVEMVKIERLMTRHADNAWREFGEQERAESGYWGIEDKDITVVYERYRKENI